jgi:translation initiation factor 1
MSLKDIEKELGLDDALAVESSVVTIRVDSRRYGKKVTVLEGFDTRVDLDALAKSLKNQMGAGGTSRDGTIELQGDHRRAATEWLRAHGYTVG